MLKNIESPLKGPEKRISIEMVHMSVMNDLEDHANKGPVQSNEVNKQETSQIAYEIDDNVDTTKMACKIIHWLRTKQEELRRRL